MSEVVSSIEQANTTIDPVTASVIQGALENVAIEMGYKLMRMSYSSIIRESEDFGAALIDRHCRQLCESKQSTPLQSGPIPGYVRGILAEMKKRGETLRPGDVVMHNDAYNGASHGPDVGFCVPVFHGGDLVGFSMTTAHHLDIGALAPGSCGIVEAVDAYAEGLQFKAIKVYDEGKRNDAVWQLLRDNIRVSDLVVGDMEAQVAAARIGADRHLELIERYGLATIEAAAEALFDHSERMMRDAIRKLPDGEFTATTYIDGYENDPDPAYKKLPITATVRIEGDELTVDLTGTAPQVPDRPINMPLAGTVDVAIWLVLRSILLDTSIYGDIPQNSGLTRPIKIVAPRGTLANPVFPAPTIARFCPGNAVADTIMKALAQAVPSQVSAGIGNLKVVAFSGMRDGQHWVHMEIFEGSYGGRQGKDGMDAVDTLYANTRNNPIEDVETHTPLRVERYELRDQVGGAGRWRGGVSTVKEISFLSDGGASIEGEGHMFRPWGLDGGDEGQTAQALLAGSNGDQTSLPSKLQYRAIRAGERLICLGAGGGGFGDPKRRDPSLVVRDVGDGLFTPQVARDVYAVAVKDGALDEAETNRLRG
ncbi:MAG: hydantoinase B/oxoprolinase family protein [Alphaproteobacteria bacterium]